MLQWLGVDLEQDRRLGELVLLLPARMEFSDPAYRLPVQDDPRRASGMQRRVDFRLVTDWPRVEQRLQVAFAVEEFHGTLSFSPLLLECWPDRCRRDAHGLANPGHIQRAFRYAWLAQVNAAYLEHPNPRCPAVQVIADVLDQPAQQGA